MRYQILRVALGAALLGPFVAQAQTVTNINLCSIITCNNPWTDQQNGGLIAAAPAAGNTGSGLSFPDYNGTDVALAPAGDSYKYDGSVTVTLPTPIGLTSSAAVNSLVNNFFGTPNVVQAVITFTNSEGATDVFSLVGNQTVRDYNNYIYTNTLTGSNSNPAFGAVSAREWWNDNGDDLGNSTQRLDAQTFVLPASWAGTSLVSITIMDPASGDWDVISGLQVVNSGSSGPPPKVPEPGTLALLGLGLAGSALARRRRPV